MFIYLRKAHYHETDQMGVVHHSNYVKWMEEARVAFMDELGFSYRRTEAAGILSPVVSLGVEYKKPVTFDDTVEIRVSVERYSGVVLELSYGFYDHGSGEQRTTAVSRHCFLKDGRPVSLKKALPELDEKLRSA